MRALLAIVLVAAGLSGCDREEQKVVMRSAPSSQTTLHRGNGSEPDSLDPHKGEGTSGASIRRDLFEGLVTTAADGSLEPGAASSWIVSDDGLTYTFRLREDGRWSNGEAVTAGDFVYGLRRSVDPETGTTSMAVACDSGNSRLPASDAR